MPTHAFLLAAFLPALAAVARLALHGEVGTWALLIWLVGLAPVFLLTRYLAWRGALIGLAWTSAMVVLAELFAAVMDARSPEWSLVGAVVAVAASVALGTGIERQWWAEGGAAARAKPAEEPPRADDLPSGDVLGFVLDRLFESARRKPPLSVALIEVDRFDEYASLYGPERAGRANDVAVQALRSQTRASDVCGRLDARRLVVLLEGETRAAAHGFAARVLEEASELSAPWNGRITLSVGIAGFELGMPDSEALLERARQALETARQMGGGRIVVAEGESGERLVTPGMTVVSPDGRVREIRGSV